MQLKGPYPGLGIGNRQAWCLDHVQTIVSARYYTNAHCENSWIQMAARMPYF